MMTRRVAPLTTGLPAIPLRSLCLSVAKITAVRAVSVYSRSDGIVSWEACLDRYAEHVEVESSHCGMSVNAEVYRVLAGILDREEATWTG